MCKLNLSSAWSAIRVIPDTPLYTISKHLFTACSKHKLQQNFTLFHACTLLLPFHATFDNYRVLYGLEWLNFLNFSPYLYYSFPENLMKIWWRRFHQVFLKIHIFSQKANIRKTFSIDRLMYMEKMWRHILRKTKSTKLHWCLVHKNEIWREGAGSNQINWESFPKFACVVGVRAQRARL